MIDRFVNAPFIVLGYHRSGTSLLAGLLNACGINMGADLFPATASNIKGHFEEVNILNFQKDMMQRSCESDGGIEKFPTRDVLNACWSYSEAINAVHAGFPHLKQHVPENIPWGWKDPRTLVFIQQWLQLFPEARLIFVVRHPALVATSLKRRDGWDEATILKSWHHFHFSALELLRGTRHVVFMYSRLVDEPSIVPVYFNKVLGTGDMLDFEPCEDAFVKCNALADPSLMHCKTEDVPLSADVKYVWSVLKSKATMYL